jgi:hypothetical protein
MEKMMKSKNFLKIISIITLIVNIALTIVNLYIVAQINQTLMTLGSFNGHLNTAFVVRAEASNLILEKPSIYIMEGEKPQIHSAFWYVKRTYSSNNIKLQRRNR